MQTYQFQLKACDKLGVLERILRVVRHRGGRLINLSMQVQPDTTLELVMELHTSRPADFIATQLAKLVDVISVQVK